MSTPVEPRDLAAAVAAGLLSERQAADLAALAETRAGLRARMPKDDEPFELFRGLNDLFVATGLVLLIFGGASMLGPLGGSVAGGAAGGAAVCWALAEYFTRIRRMILPSIVLALGVTLFAMVAGGALLFDGPVRQRDIPALSGIEDQVAAAIGVGAGAAVLFFLRFRLPFAVFLTGLLLLPPLFALTGAIDGPRDIYLLLDDPSRAFDLQIAGPVALTTLGFGLGAFALAMGFDMRDPHRLGRLSRCGFWLHLLAAPAIVNTVALSLWRTQTTGALAALVAVIVLMTVVALVIDRRSFLLSAAVYVGAVLSVSLGDLDAEIAVPAILVLLGAAITGLGAGWVSARGSLMRALPPFPGKAYLPPYRGQEVP